MASSNKPSIYGTAQAKLSASTVKTKSNQKAKIQVYCPAAIKYRTVFIIQLFLDFFSFYILAPIYSFLQNTLEYCQE